ncbi:MAG: hypothetical protein AAGA31_03595 [Bacteroidota bacterium]
MPTTQSIPIADLVLEQDKDGRTLAYLAKDYPKQKTLYKVAGKAVSTAVTFPRHEILLLRTEKGEYLRDYDNQPIDEQWSDHYFEPLTHSLYRKDERGNWYDIEGFRVAAPVFLKGDVLVSLLGKRSRRSWAFADQEAVISPNAQLIQVGKLVYDIQLEPVRYFGEKISGLGRGHVSFGGEDQWQEIRRGFHERGYLNEFTKVPLVIYDEEILAHKGSVTHGGRQFAVFSCAKSSYVVEGDSETILHYEGQPLSLDLSTYLELNEHEIVLADTGVQQFYYDLDTRKPFLLPETGQEHIIAKRKETVRLAGTTLYNMRTANRSFVYDQAGRTLFTLENEDLAPEFVAEVPGFTDHYFLVQIAGRSHLALKHSRRLVRLGDDNLEVAEILSDPKRKLLNARDVQGRELVVDVRQGLAEPSLAEIDGQRVLRTLGEVHRIGDRALQHILIDSLGGSVERIIDLEEPELRLFTLPASLTEYPDQPEPSSFAGNPLLRIDFADLEVVQDVSYYRGVFLSYLGEERPVILQTANCRPLHLDGGAHRNELVMAFKEHTKRRPYRLGDHRMIGAYTLTEDMKEGEILLSLYKNQSWLPFYDTFLPVFRRAIELPGEEHWDCYLFEVRDATGKGEYIAVEKDPPYRVLAKKSRRKVVPKIVTSKTRVLSDPDELTAMRKFFMADPGMLVEVE